VSQVYAVPFVPTVIRLPSEANPAVTFGTEPGLGNRTGCPVTAPLSPGFTPAAPTAGAVAFGALAWRVA